MTNGPHAKIAEIVENTLPKDRSRTNIHKHANYYALRNHLLDFLVTRSKAFSAESDANGYDPKKPPIVRPGARPVAVETGPPEPGHAASA